MVSGVPGPGGGSQPPQPSNEPKQVQTGMSKVYSGAKAPGFKKWLEIWFGPEVTPQMVTAFESNVMQMISASINRSKRMHEEVQRKIKERIERGG